VSKPVILCVDDERIILTSLKSQLLTNLGETYQIELAESGEEALEIIEEFRERRIDVPLVIADQIMGGMYGDELLALIKAQMPQTLSIMLTGQATAESVGAAVNKAGLYRYISKPWDEEDLILTVQTALQSYYHQIDLRRQESYQNAINRILQMVLFPIPFEDKISQALNAVLATRCFKTPNKGSIYIADLESLESMPSNLVMMSQVNNGIAPDDSTDLREEYQTVKFVSENSESFSQFSPYYQAPIVLRDNVVGFLYVYVTFKHRDIPQARAFLSSVCHTLAGIIRLFQYNQTIEKYSTELESLVENRTQKLNQALQKQAQLNDILLSTNKKLEYFATTDELTGLANRRYFFERADEETSRANRYQRKTTLVMLDIDFFKEVNDHFGHHAGDRVLTHISTVIANTVREHDIVARVGGEEFAIVLPETDLTEAKELSERIRQAISEAHVMIGSQQISVTASIGISEAKLEETTISNAMLRADQALYDSKDKGRNRISLN